jgi:hypothetical protein
MENYTNLTVNLNNNLKNDSVITVLNEILKELTG